MTDIARHVLKAFLFSMTANLLYHFIIPILYGMYQTFTYLPEITNAYAEVDYLQNEVVFGVVARPGLFPALMPDILLGMVLYGGIVWVWGYVKKRLPTAK